MGHIQSIYLALLNGKQIDGGVTIKEFIPEVPQVKQVSRDLPSALNKQFSMALMATQKSIKLFFSSSSSYSKNQLKS